MNAEQKEIERLNKIIDAKTHDITMLNDTLHSQRRRISRLEEQVKNLLATKPELRHKEAESGG